METYAPYPLNLLRDWLHRHRWKIRAIAWTVVGIWLGMWTSVRLTMQPVDPGVPADLSGGPSPLVEKPPKDRDVTLKLIKAMGQLVPPSVLVPATAPAGYRWAEPSTTYWMAQTNPASYQVDPAVALNGPWDPEHRAHLAAVIRYLDNPATQAAMRDIDDLAREPFALSAYQGLPYRDVRMAARHFVARARYRLTEQPDIDTALADLDTTLALSSGLGRERIVLSILVDIAIRSLVLEEMRCWLNEHRFEDADLAAMASLLDRHPFDWRQTWQDAIDSEYHLALSTMDYVYTNDGHGNGRLVVSHLPKLDWNRGEASPAVVNLFSFAFRDRARETSKLRARYQHLRAQAESIYEGFDRHDRDTRQGAYAFCPPTSMWIVQGLSTPMTRIAELLRMAAMDYAATHAAVAIERFLLANGHRPTSLDELVPDYLDALPIDAFSGKPLCYRRLPDGSYRLYSVWEDEVDNGGAGRDLAVSDEWDRVYLPALRDEPEKEWILVPADAGEESPTQ